MKGAVMAEVDSNHSEVLEVYKTFMLTLKRLLRNEEDVELREKAPLAFGKCFTTIEFNTIKSPEMVNRVKKLNDEMDKMDYFHSLKALKEFLDDLKRAVDVVRSTAAAGTVEWIKLKSGRTKKVRGIKEEKRERIITNLLKARRLLAKEMLKTVSWSKSNDQRIEKLERLIEKLRNYLASREGVSTSTGRYSMETAPEFTSCGIQQVDDSVKELLAKCFPTGRTLGSSGRQSLRCPSHWDIRDAVLRANEEHSLGLPMKNVDELGTAHLPIPYSLRPISDVVVEKFATEIGLAVKSKEKYDFQLYMQDLEEYVSADDTTASGSGTDDSSVETDEDEMEDQSADHSIQEEPHVPEDVDVEGRKKDAKVKHQTEVEKKFPKRKIILTKVPKDGAAEKQSVITDKSNKSEPESFEGRRLKRPAVDDANRGDDVSTEDRREPLRPLKSIDAKRTASSSSEQQRWVYLVFLLGISEKRKKKSVSFSNVPKAHPAVTESLSESVVDNPEQKGLPLQTEGKTVELGNNEHPVKKKRRKEPASSSKQRMDEWKVVDHAGEEPERTGKVASERHDDSKLQKEGANVSNSKKRDRNSSVKTKRRPQPSPYKEQGNKTPSSCDVPQPVQAVETVRHSELVQKQKGMISATFGKEGVSNKKIVEPKSERSVQMKNKLRKPVARASSEVVLTHCLIVRLWISGQRESEEGISIQRKEERSVENKKRRKGEAGSVEAQANRRHEADEAQRHSFEKALPVLVFIMKKRAAQLTERSSVTPSEESSRESSPPYKSTRSRKSSQTPSHAAEAQIVNGGKTLPSIKKDGATSNDAVKLHAEDALMKRSESADSRSLKLIKFLQSSLRSGHQQSRSASSKESGNSRMTASSPTYSDEIIDLTLDFD
ncbi:hypothetical protein M513_00783 [Trichuris suis]|uniref:Uncharacterized protein n=1 Tax=Trichuris suis TaxID=68888 RepID=A0A085MMW1_9BILA|nr:hypothetical protein M513_00783 [Trichuris suis]